MFILRSLGLLFVYVILASGVMLSASAKTVDPPKPETQLSQLSKLIVSTAFAKDHPSTRKGTIEGWNAAIGVWQVKDRALHGDELPEDKHHSSCTWRAEATDVVLTAEFKLGAAQQIAFGCRDAIAPHHHLARIYITPDALWITRMSGIAKTTTQEKLTELKVPVDCDQWHKVTIEICGNQYCATIDNHALTANHERFADTKGIFALITKGQGAQFRNVSIWHGKPKEKSDDQP